MSLTNDLAQINHNITLEDAVEMTTRYRAEMPDIIKEEYADANVFPISETFRKNIFTELVSQHGCVAIRSYLGMDEEQQVKLIFVGVDDNNEDILPIDNAPGLIFEYGNRCPPICGATSPLNS